MTESCLSQFYRDRLFVLDDRQLLVSVLTDDRKLFFSVLTEDRQLLVSVLTDDRKLFVSVLTDDRKLFVSVLTDDRKLFVSVLTEDRQLLVSVLTEDRQQLVSVLTEDTIGHVAWETCMLRGNTSAQYHWRELLQVRFLFVCFLSRQTFCVFVVTSFFSRQKYIFVARDICRDK